MSEWDSGRRQEVGGGHILVTLTKGRSEDFMPGQGIDLDEGNSIYKRAL